MIGGVGLVMGMMVLMNRYTQPPAKEKPRATTRVQVKQTKPKPKKQAKRRSRPKPKQRRMPRQAPQPKLAGSLSGINLGHATRFGQPSDTGGNELLGGDNARNLLMTSDTVDEPPRAMRKVSPRYPLQARKDGITGFVTFSLVIGPEGQVQRSKIVRAKPMGVFEESAKRAIERWTFKPGLYKGRAQTVVVEQTIRFNLSRGA